MSYPQSTAVKATDRILPCHRDHLLTSIKAEQHCKKNSEKRLVFDDFSVLSTVLTFI